MTTEVNAVVNHALTELRDCISGLSDVIYTLTLERETGGGEREQLRNVQRRLWNIPIGVKEAQDGNG